MVRAGRVERPINALPCIHYAWHHWTSSVEILHTHTYIHAYIRIHIRTYMDLLGRDPDALVVVPLLALAIAPHHAVAIVHPAHTHTHM